MHEIGQLMLLYEKSQSYPPEEIRKWASLLVISQKIIIASNYHLLKHYASF